MKTVNSISGGKTSAYIAAHYPADYDVFSLVRTDDKNCMFPDSKIRQEVSDKLGTEFIGTLEDDMIIYTMLDLEQYIGRKITWVTGKTFDKAIKTNKDGTKYLPNKKEIRFIKGRVKFIGVNTFGERVVDKGAMHDSMIVILKKMNNKERTERFAINSIMVCIVLFLVLVILSKI